jgi:RNA polymerase sigma-70 factor (ECF subfamily)
MTIRKSGDPGRDERFEAIYRRQYAKVYRYYTRACRVSDDEAHDLAQDTFKRFYERMDQMRGEDEGPFVKAIARSVLLNWIRARETAKRSARMVRLDDPDGSIDLPAPAGPDYAERQEHEQRQNQLREAIAELPETQRQCMEPWLAGSQYDEIAKALGISMDAVKTRIKNAKKLLSARLGDTIPEDEE